MYLNFKFDEKMIAETANRVLDETEYKGKTIREWADLIANPKTNADRIRSMTDEEIENWYWWMHKEMMYYTDSYAFVHDWLKSPAEERLYDSLKRGLEQAISGECREEIVSADNESDKQERLNRWGIAP